MSVKVDIQIDEVEIEITDMEMYNEGLTEMLDAHYDYSFLLDYVATHYKKELADFVHEKLMTTL